MDDYGIKGLALATLITYSSNLIGAHIYVHYYIYKNNDQKLSQAWFWPDKNTLVDMKSYATLALNCSASKLL